jgi:Zn-dependent protease
MGELTPDVIATGLIWFVVFLFSTTCHEAAHALVAKLGGDPTASGQITLNPTPHIQREPFGMVVVPLVSYFLSGWVMGWASAPSDPVWAYRHPHRAARMALAGPAANFTLMLAAAVGIRVGIALNWFESSMPRGIQSYAGLVVATDSEGILPLLATVLSIAFLLNLVLGIFNLLPVPPLDGNVGITFFMSESMARSFLDFFRVPNVALAGVIVAWVVFYRGFPYVFWPVMQLLYGS